MSIGDNTNLYLDSVSKYPLLSHNEERSLGIIIQDNYIRYKKEGIGTIISEESLKYIKSSMEEGKKARNKLVKSSLLLVASIAKRYNNKGLPLDDLIQEGNIGLIKASERFNPYREERFSTYAIHWIKQSIRRALTDTSRTIRVPDWAYLKIKSLKKTIDTLESNTQRSPTNKEISKNMKLPETEVKVLKEAESIIEKNKRMVRISRIPDYEKRIPSKRIEQASQDLEELIEKTIKKDVYKEVIKMRFGMNGYKEMTFEEIGKITNKTGARIQQIEKNCIMKLYKAIKNENI